MPRLVGDNTELGCSKLKTGNGFLKPNFETGPNWTSGVSGTTGCLAVTG